MSESRQVTTAVPPSVLRRPSRDSNDPFQISEPLPDLMGRASGQPQNFVAPAPPAPTNPQIWGGVMPLRSWAGGLGPDLVPFIAGQLPYMESWHAQLFREWPLTAPRMAERFADVKFRLTANFRSYYIHINEVQLSDLESLFGQGFVDVLNDTLDAVGALPFEEGQQISEGARDAATENLSNELTLEGKGIELGGQIAGNLIGIHTFGEKEQFGVSALEVGFGAFGHLSKVKSTVGFSEPAQPDAPDDAETTDVADPQVSRDGWTRTNHGSWDLWEKRTEFLGVGGGLSASIAPLSLYLRGRGAAARFDPLVMEGGAFLILDDNKWYLRGIVGNYALQSRLTLSF